MASETDFVRIACAVAFRKNADQIEFCLVTACGTSNWEFPKTLIIDGAPAHACAWSEAERTAGLKGRLIDEQPLAQVRSTRANERVEVTAYLFEVTHEAIQSDADAVRRRWCLPEEARVRLRRKPLRRMIDIALERVQERSDHLAS